MSREMTGGQAIVEAIRQEGITHAFTVPGESFLPVLDALYEQHDVTAVATRHEEGAGFMAEGYAKASGKPGVCMATRAVGSSNLGIALHTAYQDSTPLVAFVGQVSTRFRHREAFQEVNLADHFRHITKWSVEIGRMQRIPELVERAFRIAKQGRPGPVLVSLPEDVLWETAPVALHGPTRVLGSRPTETDVADAIGLLQTASRPMILVGGGVLRAEATNIIVELADTLGAGIFSAFRRFDAVPNEHPLYLGPSTLGIRPAVMAPLREADVILVLGCRLSEVTTQGYALFNPGANIIQVDTAPEVVGAVHPVAVGIVSDVKLAVADLLKAAREAQIDSSPNRRTRLEAVAEFRERYESLTSPAQFQGGPVDPEGVVHDLQQLLPKNTAVVSDAGNFSGWVYRYFRFPGPGTQFGPTSGAMGYGLPAGIGVKVAKPDIPVLVTAGDGGFAMTMNELNTAVRLQLTEFVVVVFNNSLYGTIAAHQMRHFPDRPVAVDLGDVDFAGVARAMGAHGERVQRNEEFPAALQRALHAGRPALLDLIVRPERLSAWKDG